MKMWPRNILDYYWLHDVQQIYLDMGVWAIRWDGKDGFEWMELTPQSGTKLRPPHFEIVHDKQAGRDRYHLECFRRLVREKQPLVTQHNGFHDIFIPLGPMEGGYAALYSGHFLKRPADWDSLADQWTHLTGHRPVGSDPEFLSYVRMCLKLPVFEGPLLKGVLEFLRNYADFLMGGGTPEGIHERVNQLRREVFAPRLPNTPWIDEALGFEKLAPPPWGWYKDRQLAPWMREELGIGQIPTTVFAVMPILEGGDVTDPAKALLLNYQIQRECQGFSRKLSETVAGNLQDYGAVFLTSPKNSKNDVQGRFQVREKAEAVRSFLKKRFGLRSMAGIGRPVPKGETLYRSYQEALLALHFCVQSEKSILSYDEDPRAHEGPAYARLERAALDLLAAHGQASADAIKVAADQYVREVLEFASSGTEAIRGQFLSILFRLLEKVRHRSVLSKEDEADLIARFCGQLTEADSAYRLIDVFKETLRAFSGMAISPLKGSQEVRIRTVLRHVEEHFAQPLKLPDVARRAGFSVPVFCRVFKRTTGMSFAAYLGKFRVERSKSLLKNGRLSLLEVGNVCGFQTAHQFIRNFKRWNGRTPGLYRQELSRGKR